MRDMPRPNTEPMHVEDIRPAALMADKQSCLEADRRMLLDRRSEWVWVRCPACAGDVPEVFGTKDGFAYQQCRACETVYTNPRPSPVLLHTFYATSANYAYWNRHVFPVTEAARRTRIFEPRAARLLEAVDRLQPGARTVLEVGAGFGTFCETLRRTGRFERIVAVEPTPDLAETCRGRGLETLETPIERVGAIGQVDVVVAFEVIEHLFDPADFIDRCHELLGAGGLLVLSCPNVKGFDVATLGLRSGTFDHEHLNYFHPDALATLAARCGFDVLEISTPGELDAEIVRRHVLAGDIDLAAQPFLHDVLINRWGEAGQAFQSFLVAARRSSHMWLIARRRRT